MKIGRPKKFENGVKRGIQLPLELWNKLDEIAADQGRFAQDVIYEKLKNIEYIPTGNIDELIEDIRQALKKHSTKKV